jgi:hypothetical protein
MSSHQQNLLTFWQVLLMLWRVLLILSVVRLYPACSAPLPRTINARLGTSAKLDRLCLYLQAIHSFL